jgi:mono/diheme cytochrome c family protein
VSSNAAGWPLRRIVVVPLVLFVLVSAGVFALAKLHLARPSVAASGTVKLGDFYRGQVIFSQTCAGCHGTDGKGGGVGPRLQDAHITLAAAQAQIENGGSVMPGGLVKGSREADVLAYLATIFAH